MASAPQNLPMFYNDLIPLNSNEHADWSTKPLANAAFVKNQHAIPVTTDEFVQAGRHYPIIFSAGEKPVPLALMGMNEGVNIFVDDEGKFNAPVYLPAYIRRYPFMLAKLSPDADELSLCFDPSSGGVGAFDDGMKLFDGLEPSQTTKDVLSFCEQFEQAGARTQAFVDDLIARDLLMDGEVSINQQGGDQPFVYRGFKMINEEKLRELRGDELRKMNQNGMLPLIYAHLFSLQLMRDIFAGQAAAGKIPQLGTVGQPG